MKPHKGPYVGARARILKQIRDPDNKILANAGDVGVIYSLTKTEAMIQYKAKLFSVQLTDIEKYKEKVNDSNL